MKIRGEFFCENSNWGLNSYSMKCEMKTSLVETYFKWKIVQKKIVFTKYF